MPAFRQISTFFGVGLVATVADWGSFFLMGRFTTLGPVAAALIAYVCGGIVSYALNRLHTFDTERTHLEAGWRFASVMAVGFSLTGICVWLFADRLGLDRMASRVLATGIVFFWNYAAHKVWTFGDVSQVRLGGRRRPRFSSGLTDSRVV